MKTRASSSIVFRMSMYILVIVVSILFIGDLMLVDKTEDTIEEITSSSLLEAVSWIDKTLELEFVLVRNILNAYKADGRILDAFTEDADASTVLTEILSHSSYSYNAYLLDGELNIIKSVGNRINKERGLASLLDIPPANLRNNEGLFPGNLEHFEVNFVEPSFKSVLGVESATVVPTLVAINDLDTGEFLGYIEFDLRLSAFIYETIANLDYPLGARVSILDSAGTYVAIADTSYLGSQATYFNELQLADTTGLDQLIYQRRDAELGDLVEYIAFFQYNEPLGLYQILEVSSESFYSESQAVKGIVLATSAVTTLLIIAVVIFILLTLIVFRLNLFNEIMLALSKGSLNKKIKISKNDEIGEVEKTANKLIKILSNIIGAIKMLVEKSRFAILTLRNSSILVQQMAEEISQGLSRSEKMSDNLSKITKDAVDSSNEILKIVQTQNNHVSEQTDSINRTAETMENMNESFQDLSRVALGSKKTSDELEQIIADGSTSVEEVASTISLFSKSIEEMRSIITVIDDITEQTNLLSMNAAIEAAHAGTTGQGFAVVANEIRSLASTTSGNAKHISNTLNNMMFSIERAQEASKVNKAIFSQIQLATEEFVSSFVQVATSSDALSESSSKITNSIFSLRENADELLAGEREIQESSNVISQILKNVQESSEKSSESTIVQRFKSNEINILQKEFVVMTALVEGSLDSLANAADFFSIEGLAEDPILALCNFSTVVAYNQQLRINLLDAVTLGSSDLDPKTIGNHESNPMGDLLYSLWITEKFKYNKNYKQLLAANIEEHAMAQEILDLLVDERLDEARKRYIVARELSIKITERIVVFQNDFFALYFKERTAQQDQELQEENEQKLSARALRKRARAQVDLDSEEYASIDDSDFDLDSREAGFAPEVSGAAEGEPAKTQIED